MAFTRFYITDQGMDLLAKTLTGTPLVLTKAEIGDGELPEGQSITGVRELYSILAELNISSIDYISPKQVKANIQFTNEECSRPFWWKEIGLFANDPDLGEILYAYGNAGDKADYIESYGTMPMEFVFQMLLSVASAESVSVNIDDSMVYVTRKELNEALTKYGGAYAGPESMAADLPPLGVLFVTEIEPQLEAVAYDNMIFAVNEPTKGENWAQLESQTVQKNMALNTTTDVKSGITFENGRLTVSKTEPDDSTFWNKL